MSKEPRFFGVAIEGLQSNEGIGISPQGGQNHIIWSSGIRT